LLFEGLFVAIDQTEGLEESRVLGAFKSAGSSLTLNVDQPAKPLRSKMHSKYCFTLENR
jgi:hypothetical protein